MVRESPSHRYRLLLFAVLATFFPLVALAQVPCQSDADCVDPDRCNGAEVCGADGFCAAGSPLDCDDANDCTADRCDPATGCIHECAPRHGCGCFVKIGNYVWKDKEADGLQEENLGVEGVRLEILRCEGGVPGDVVGTATTDEHGTWAFRLTTCGDESLAVRVAEGNFGVRGPLYGYLPSPADAGADDAADSDCDPATLTTACVDVPLGTADWTVDCGFYGGVCRSPGFWSNHGGEEKPGSHNFTQGAIDSAGGYLQVCGQTVDATVPVGGLESALEALCVQVQGVQQRQLYRQLTAAALNCAASGAGGCERLFPGYDACDQVCAEGEAAEPRIVTRCIEGLACQNDGGRVGPDGKCYTGTCLIGSAPCGPEVPCFFFDPNRDGRNENLCRPLCEDCHRRPLCASPDPDLCFESQGPASSTAACGEARRNDCTIDDCP